MKPFYSDDSVTIYHGDSEGALAQLRRTDTLADHLITDPPYDARTHEQARGGGGSDEGRGFVERGFGSFTEEDTREALFLAGELTRRWGIVSLPWHLPARLYADPVPGWRFVRAGVWVKPNGAPQFTGDRPAQGWEAIAILHRELPGRMRWNGGGARAVWTHNIAQGKHPTQKPLGLLKEWIRQFTDPGDLILDPFMGSGTTLRAAKDLGRRAIGIELNGDYCEIAARRMSQ